MKALIVAVTAIAAYLLFGRQNRNQVELIPTTEGFIAVVTTPTGEMHTYEMTQDEYDRLREAINR